MQNKPEKQSRLAAFMGLFFVLFGLVFVIGSWGAYFTDSSIQNHGLSAQGYIEKKVFLMVADGDSDFILDYWFVTQSGAKIHASHHVSKTLWQAVREHQTITIMYSANNPKRNFPTGTGVTSLGMSIFNSVLGALFTLFGGALIWGYFRPVSN